MVLYFDIVGAGINQVFILSTLGLIINFKDHLYKINLSLLQ